jgi:HK97 family phage major capsid protein
MAFNGLIDRTDATALIPEDAVREIFASVPESSAVARLARRLRDMTRGEMRLPVLSALPDVYFVGEKGRSPQTFDGIKQTSEAAWENKYIHAEEMACIVPIPENVLEDADYDIWAEIRPYISEAIGKKIDAAVLFGESDVDVPANWPDGILVGMPADHQISVGELSGDLYDDLLGVGGVWSKVEEDGYDVDGVIAALSLKASLRGLRDENGQPIFVTDMKAANPYSIWGSGILFPKNGGFDPSQALAIAGQWDQLVWSVRRDVTFKVLTEGVITDNASPRAIIHNLAQDDMIALRVTFRMGWQLPNPINRVNTDDSTRYPFAAYIPAGS